MQEVRDTVRKAYHDRLNGTKITGGGVAVLSCRRTNQMMLPELLHPNEDLQVEALFNASPVKFDPDDGRQQFITVLEKLFEPDEFLFCGKPKDTDVHRVSAWIEAAYTAKNIQLPSHMIWNPMTGEYALTNANTESKRCDASVAKYRYTVAEFDSTPLDVQLRFWAWAQLPVAAIVFSGGKSYHAVLRLRDVDTKMKWNLVVKQTIYNRWLVPLGADSSCSNPSRLSRCPGSVRTDTGILQRLIYLNPDADPLRLKA